MTNSEIMSSCETDKDLLIFFNGWGMDDNVINHLSAIDYDLVTVFDYEKPIDLQLYMSKNYRKKILIAWSFGVYMAAISIKDYKFDYTIAINGTLKPIDCTNGIDPEIFSATLNNLDEINLQHFYKRCCLKNKPQRNLSNIKKELEFIRNKYNPNNDIENIFNFAVIGKLDKIFKPQNQTNYWLNKTNIVNMEIPHYPFLGFKSWKEFIDAATGR